MPSNAPGLRGRESQPNSPAGSNGAVLKSVGATADTPASGTVQNVGMDHRRFQMVQEILDRSNIISVLDQVSGKTNARGRTAVRNMIRAGVPQSVAMSITGHETDSVFRGCDIVSQEDKIQALRRTAIHLTASEQEQRPCVPGKRTRTRCGNLGIKRLTDEDDGPANR